MWLFRLLLWQEKGHTLWSSTDFSHGRDNQTAYLRLFAFTCIHTWETQEAKKISQWFIKFSQSNSKLRHFWGCNVNHTQIRTRWCDQFSGRLIAPFSADKFSYNIAHNRQPRNWLFFGDDQNNPPFPCKLKCCLKCCKKDRILCIIQVMLLTTIIGQLMIINTLLVICDFFPLIILPPCFPIGGRRRKRSVLSVQKPMGNASFFEYHEQTFTSSEDDIYEVARNIINSLSSIVRTRDFAIDLRYAPRKCQTCIPCRVQTIRPLTDGLIHIGRYIGR